MSFFSLEKSLCHFRSLHLIIFPFRVSLDNKPGTERLSEGTVNPVSVATSVKQATRIKQACIRKYIEVYV